MKTKVLVFLFGIMWACSGCKSYPPASEQTYYGMDEVGPAAVRTWGLQQTPKVKYILNHPYDPSNIPRILRVMRKQGVRDLNHDGKINCIDHSLTFYRLYGRGAEIVINNNKSTGMNHMFIIVRQALNEWHIEPQGTPKLHDMGMIWGMKYDPYYNRYVTSVWGGWYGGVLLRKEAQE